MNIGSGGSYAIGGLILVVEVLYTAGEIVALAKKMFIQHQFRRLQDVSKYQIQSFTFYVNKINEGQADQVLVILH